MSEGDYEYELMRSELLGLPPPEKKALPPNSGEEGTEDFSVEDSKLATDQNAFPKLLYIQQEVGVDDDQLQNATGGLDEINSILSITQKKLNKFKVVCGSLTSLLKIRVAGANKEDGSSNCSSRGSIVSDTEGQPDEDVASPTITDEATVTNTTKTGPRTAVPHDLDLAGQLGSQVDRLDSMLMKAEQAEMSMASQNKQMKAFLNK